MNAGSLFSGVGGLDLGLHRAGIRHAFFCESDPWRRTVLAAHWPGVPVYDDVATVGSIADPGEGRDDHRTLGGTRRGERAVLPIRHEVPSVDLLCGGFPCQDLSVAGQRRGLNGDRSGLFFEFARIIELVRPRWVLLENVPGLLSSNGGRDFGTVLGTLADIGYSMGWRILDSRYFGVPQRRRRVFILGALTDGNPRAAADRAGQVLAVGTRCPGHPPTGTEAGPLAAVASLSGLGTGGADDNDGQAGRVVVSTLQNAGRHPRGVPSTDEAAGGQLVTQTHLQSTGSQLGVRVAVNDDDSHDRVGHGHLEFVGAAEGVALDLVVEDVVRVAESKSLALDAIDTNHEFHCSSNRDGDAHIVTGSGAGCKRWDGDTSSRSPAPVGVRRLTPVECERLQAWPDGWTNPDGTAPDSRRYAACGDGVTATVGEWIGRRLMAA
jgi:DNA (cytosine-5)-methyltransferase 1